MPRRYLEIPKPLIGALLCLIIAGGTLAVRAPVVHGDGVVIFRVHVTDVRDTSFVVSWTTDAVADGFADWGTSVPPPNTASDPAGPGTAHRVVIPNSGALAAGTLYSVQVRSGGAVENNAGGYYRATTGPTLALPAPGNTVWGYVYGPGGVTPAANAVVFLRVRDRGGFGSAGKSQWVTARTDASGIWYYGLNNVRTADAANYFVLDPGLDRLEIIARGGSMGAAEADVLVPSHFPGGAARLADIVLAEPLPAVAPQVTVSLVGAHDVRLGWSHTPANAEYEVWQSNKPYFAPRSSGTHRLGELERPELGGSLYFTHENAAGVPASCDFYVVLAYDLGGKPANPLNRVGQFTFALTPGGP